MTPAQKQGRICADCHPSVLRMPVNVMIRRMLLYGFTLLLALIAGCGGTPPSAVSTATVAPTATVLTTTLPASETFMPQTSDEGQVVIQVTPITLQASKPALFEIAMDTHSVELDADLMQAALLRDDAGNESKPTAWEGPGAGGHHRAGKLSFGNLNANARSVTLILKNIAQIPERVFTWQLAQTNAIPQTLGALKLTRAMEGMDALREFTSLHNKAFELTGGYRADYGDGNQVATLWVAQAKDDASALALTQDMAKKIGAGNAMFKNLQALSINGREIYVVDGQGQQHYFYAHGDQIVWLAIDSSLAANALHELWNVK